MGQRGAKVGQDAPMWLPCRRELDFDYPKAPKDAPGGNTGRVFLWVDDLVKPNVAPKDAPGDNTGRVFPWVGDLVKPHLGRQNDAPAYTGAVFCKPAETHPAEGMTKVIPGLSNEV